MNENKSQKGFVLWLTGLSGSGKSTLAEGLYDELERLDKKFERLDGDVLRGVFPNTGFSKGARDEHIKRVGFMASRLEHHGVIVVASFISPYRAGRERARRIVGPERFIETYVDVTLAECERRDPKGLYKQARAGQIADFTGIDAPYEAPENPEVRITTEHATPVDAAGRIMEYLTEKRFLSGQ